MRHGALGILATVIALTGVARLSAQDALDENLRTNGVEVLKAIAPTVAKIKACRAVLGETKDKPVLTGLIVSADGYILTKWSELAPLKKPRVWLPDGTDVEGKVVTHDDKLDLALVKIARSGLTPVEWAGQPVAWRMGQWLCAPVHDSDEPRLGVMSARRRPIPNSGAVLGVRFEPSEKGDRGVTIEEVAHNGPADQAGLKSGDVILQVDGQTVNQTSAVRRVLSKLHPGDVIKVQYARKDKDKDKEKEAECEVKLGSANHVFMNWTGGDFANHGTSLRTDNFPDVIQHALPVTPQDMGGGLFDLEGRALGINIARVDRVTNYALPAESFLPMMQQWLQEDRGRQGK